jgi:pimeloyl-ACP methyl ester carboxylesterase
MQAQERSGREPAVVFIHGFCQSSAYWAPTLTHLADEGPRGLAMDLPGFGMSAAEPGPHTMEGYADALAAFLTVKGLDQVVLVGGSMGGVIAQHFILRYPGRVLRLLLVATGAITADPAGALDKATALEAAPWNEATVKPIVDGFFYRSPPAADLAKYRMIALQASQPAAVSAARSNANSNTLDGLSKVAVPTFIIQGRYDRARTPEHGSVMQQRIAGSQLFVIEDAGHTPHLEQPDRFHEIALPFLIARS